VSEFPQQERFVTLLDEHKKIVHKVASAYSRSAADRTDLAQEIVAQLWRAFPSYDPERRFSTWMYRIALNVAISAYRREARRAAHPEAPLLHLPDEAPDERLQQLHQAIEHLSEGDRALVVLYLDGLRHETIAQILGISETNVGTRIGRIKERLRRNVATDPEGADGPR
jgi:RNA polymerase sigma factor (sigma-70 family)